MSLVFNLNYKFNTFALLTELDRHKSTICPYIDKRYGQINDFKILRSNNICTVMDQECARFLKYYNFKPLNPSSFKDKIRITEYKIKQ